MEVSTDIQRFSHLVQVGKDEAFPHIFDVELTGLERLQGFDSLEFHAVVYPYSRKVDAHHISFKPYEEYVEDIAGDQRSSYARIGEPFRNIFGIILGVFIILIFACFKPEELFSIESIVSVFGAYTVGKELWSDLEAWLVKLTDNRKLRFQPRYYMYKLERHTTVTRYSRLARKHRYGMSVVLPDQMDFIQQSNSQTIRMYFNHADYGGVLAENKVHVLSIHLDPEALSAFEEGGYMLGFKISLNRHIGHYRRSIELFQSFDGASKGCLDLQELWVPEAVLCRNTFSLSRWKWYQAQYLVPQMSLIER